MPDIIVDTPAGLAAVFVTRLGRAVESAVAARGRAAVAIPGGSVVRAFGPALAAAPLDWPRVDLFWCDERVVPPTDPESNYRLALETWLSGLPAPAPRVHRVAAERHPPDAAALDYETEMTAVLGSSPRFDLLLLGMGPDGHVASLFPGHPALTVQDRLFIAIDDAPKPPPQRLTMTLPVMRAARGICVAAFGRGKAEAVQAAVDDPGSSLPVAQVLRGHPDVVCLFDAEAARRIRNRRRV